MNALAAFVTFESALRRALCDPQQVDRGWRARCPACAGILAFDAANTSHPVIVRCRSGCTWEQIVDALRLSDQQRRALGIVREVPIRRPLDRAVSR